MAQPLGWRSQFKAVFFVVSIVCMTWPAAGAAATTVTGDSESDAPLEIAPDGTDPKVNGISVYSGQPIYAIQRMPVTKRVASITLGDLQRGCSSGSPSARLRVLESSTGKRIDAGQVAQSTNSPAFSTTGPARVTWNIPPTTFHAGRAYFFTLYNESGGCQSSVSVTTWARTGTQVNGGPGPCDQYSQEYAGQYLRHWHQFGASDWSCGTYQAPSFDSFLPDGWLLYRRTTDADPMVQVRRPDGTVQSSQCYYGTLPVYWKPHPTLSGYSLYACRFDQFSAPGVDVADGWHYVLEPEAPGTNYAQREMYVKLETIDYATLLTKYAPVVKFDSESEYWNASPQTMTDWDENDLVFNQISDPCSAFGRFEHGGPNEWGLTTLVAETDVYPGTTCVPAEADHIDADGDDKEAADSYRYGPLDNRVYGRIAHDSNGDIWLQYWLFYYYNSQSVLGIGTHQGDWEMVQYRLDATGNPNVATYSQHGDSDAESCTWSKVEKYDIEVGGVVTRVAPIVYVAAGSQASYFVPGSHIRPSLPNDEADGLGELRNTEPGFESIAGPPQWARWPGQWGEDAASPRSPGWQGTRWNQPLAFDAGAGPCSNPDGTPR